MCVFNLRWIWVMEAGMLILASLDMGILIIQKEIFVIKQIHINEEQQLLVKFSLHECEHLTDQYQYVSWANMKSFTRLSVKHVFALFSHETPQFAFELIQLIFVMRVWDVWARSLEMTSLDLHLLVINFW